MARCKEVFDYMKDEEICCNIDADLDRKNLTSARPGSIEALMK